jgi:hypothetical protein
LSTFNDIDINCENCGHEFRGTIWTAVNAQEDPELKDLLLGGELNMVMCMECAHVQYQDHFVLYQDKKTEIVAYIYPEKQKEQESELAKITTEGFREAQAVFSESKRLDYQPLLVFGLTAFVRFLHDEIKLAEQSDVAEAVCRENKIPVTVLRPSVARRQKLPCVIPGDNDFGALDRKSVLGGLSTLLEKNPALTAYAALKKTIESDPFWSAPALH